MVLLITLIALARKFVILDPDVSPSEVATLAGATLALGATYWLLRERDDRSRCWRRMARHNDKKA